LTELTIALDAMGGDIGPRAVVPAAHKALQKYPPHIRFILVGQPDVIHDVMREHHISESERLQVYPASQVIAMDELPSRALRMKKDSSTHVAVGLVKQGIAKACVSSGNTGALMVIAHLFLKTLPGIDRPALVTELPSANAQQVTRMLDLGANVDSCAEHLYQFAVMGSVLSQAVDNNPNPRVGLLNIGVEEIKGNDQVKHTAHLLAQSDTINYIGYIEADQIYSGTADVIVCDGFVGNVALKASEGAARLITSETKACLSQNFWARIAGFLAQGALRKVKKRLDPARFNGASLIGLNGIVIKSHGGADKAAFGFAIDEAVRESEKSVPQLIQKAMGDLFSEDNS